MASIISVNRPAARQESEATGNTGQPIAQMATRDIAEATADTLLKRDSSGAVVRDLLGLYFPMAPAFGMSSVNRQSSIGTLNFTLS